MKQVILTIAVLSISISTRAHAEKIQLGEDKFLNISLLIQPQFAAAQRAAPNGDVGTDLFLRRGRLILSGQYDPRISFVFITDQPNWGRNGDFSSTFIIQDALASFKVAPELTISAGFLLLPFLRNNLESAGSLNTVDFRTPVIRFPTARAFRDAGVEARGLVADERIHYRVGIFNGIAGKAATMTTPEINPRDAPRFTGMVRYNLMGKDEGYAVPGIYFATSPVISVGFGADLQSHAIGPGPTPGSTRYLGLALDAFVDYPLDADHELVAEAAIIRYDQYAAVAGPDNAIAIYVQAGYRFGLLEPVASVEYFNGDLPGSGATTYRVGLNYWLAKHTYNVKAELALPRLEQVAGGPAVQNNLTGTLQAQLVF
jgi:hypothetical protein